MGLGGNLVQFHSENPFCTIIENSLLFSWTALFLKLMELETSSLKTVKNKYKLEHLRYSECFIFH